MRRATGRKAGFGGLFVYITATAERGAPNGHEERSANEI